MGDDVVQDVRESGGGGLKAPKDENESLREDLLFCQPYNHKRKEKSHVLVHLNSFRSQMSTFVFLKKYFFFDDLYLYSAARVHSLCPTVVFRAGSAPVGSLRDSV